MGVWLLGVGCLVGGWLVCCVGVGRRVSTRARFWGTADRLGVGASSAVMGSELRSMFLSLNTGCDIVVICGDVAGVAGDFVAESQVQTLMRLRWCFWAWPGETEFKVGAHGFVEFRAFAGGKSRSPDALVQFSERSELIWLISEVLKFVQPLGRGGTSLSKPKNFYHNHKSRCVVAVGCSKVLLDVEKRMPFSVR
jgi:hypothetical protein